MLVFLGMYKEWQDKIHRELDEVLGPSEKDITLRDIDQFMYLDMVIKEILRLYTAPHTVRDVKEDIVMGKSRYVIIVYKNLGIISISDKLFIFTLYMLLIFFNAILLPFREEKIK